MMQYTRKRTFYLFLVFVILILFVSLDLILARVFIRASDRTFRTPHYYYHHGLIPNQRVIATWYNIRYPLFTNSLGFRDAQVRNVPLESTKYRILFMGDSHTEGVGVRFEDTFTGQVISQLDTTRIEILNAAAVSYSLRTYYLKAKYLLEVKGLKFDKLFVFIDLSDLQNEIVYKEYQPRELGNFKRWMFHTRNRLVNRSFSLHTKAQVRQTRHTNRFLKQAEIFDEYRQDEAHLDALDLYASFFRDFDDKTLLSNPQFHGTAEWMYDDNFVELARLGLELGGENMDSLYQLCRKHNIPLTISVHPWQIQIALKDAEDMYVRFWKNFAEERGIGFINLYHTFITPPVSAALGLNYFIPGDNHWNRNGHMLVANEVVKRIVNSEQ